MNIIKKDENNNLIIGYEPQLTNSKISFSGKNNRLIIEENVKLRNSKINFKANNSIIYLSSNSSYILNIDIHNNSVCFFDEHTDMTGKSHIFVSEEKHFFVGKNCLFSLEIWVRLADPHLIYDSITNERINLTKSVYIGDHVWIGQNVFLLKGTKIGSGSIIGANSVVANKQIPSNAIWAGNPVKEIRKNALFNKASVHAYTATQTQQSLKNDSKKGIFKNEGEILNFDEIDKFFTDTKDVDKKVEFLYKLRNNESPNRFYIE